MIQSLQVLLVARRVGHVITEPDFIQKISVSGFPVVRSQDPGGSHVVVLMSVKLSEIPNLDDRADVLDARIQNEFRRIAEWLSQQPTGAFAEAQAREIEVELFVDAWIDQNQFDFTFPASLILACAERLLPIRIVTND